MCIVSDHRETRLLEVLREVGDPAGAVYVRNALLLESERIEHSTISILEGINSLTHLVPNAF